MECKTGFSVRDLCVLGDKKLTEEAAYNKDKKIVKGDKNVVDCFKTDDAVSAMKFGRFGREENTLVIGNLH